MAGAARPTTHTAATCTKTSLFFMKTSCAIVERGHSQGFLTGLCTWFPREKLHTGLGRMLAILHIERNDVLFRLHTASLKRAWTTQVAKCQYPRAPRHPQSLSAHP